MAYQPLELVARLPVHFAWRKPARHTDHISQPGADDAARRSVAWGRMDIRGVGPVSGRAAHCISGGTRDRQRAGDHSHERAAQVCPRSSILSLDLFRLAAVSIA